MEDRANVPSLLGIAVLALPVAAVSGAVAAAALGAMGLFEPPPLTLPTRCSPTASICKIQVSVETFGLGECGVVLPSDVVLPPGVKAIEWSIVTTGYSFTADSVVFIDYPNDFGPSSASGSTLTRSFTPAQTRAYRYNISVQTGSKYCMVPTLPRIKNE